MRLPFTTEQFLAVFRLYNLAVWPIQFVLLLLAACAVGALFFNRPGRDRMISAFLSLLWAWMAIVYHLGFFTDINPAAWGFGGLFLVQAVVMAWYGVARHRIRFRIGKDLHSFTGGFLVLYALVIYPALGLLLGHSYPELPTFGLPCPTTIYTIGLLLLAEKPLPVAVLPVPLLWSVIGSVAAFQLGITQDLGLLVAGLLGVVCWFLMPRKQGSESLA